VSQFTPSTQVASPPADAVPVAVPAQVPVNGITGPVGAIVPEGGLAAVTSRMGKVAMIPAAIEILEMKLNKTQRFFN